jgi:hypothetical protein
MNKIICTNQVLTQAEIIGPRIETKVNAYIGLKGSNIKTSLYPQI